MQQTPPGKATLNTPQVVLNHSGSILKRFEPGEPLELTVAEAACRIGFGTFLRTQCLWWLHGEDYGNMMNYRIYRPN